MRRNFVKSLCDSYVPLCTYKPLADARNANRFAAMRRCATVSFIEVTEEVDNIQEFLREKLKSYAFCTTFLVWFRTYNPQLATMMHTLRTNGMATGRPLAGIKKTKGRLCLWFQNLFQQQDFLAAQWTSDNSTFHIKVEDGSGTNKPGYTAFRTDASIEYAMKWLISNIVSTTALFGVMVERPEEHVESTLVTLLPILSVGYGQCSILFGSQGDYTVMDMSLCARLLIKSIPDPWSVSLTPDDLVFTTGDTRPILEVDIKWNELAMLSILYTLLKDDIQDATPEQFLRTRINQRDKGRLFYHMAKYDGKEPQLQLNYSEVMRFILEYSNAPSTEAEQSKRRTNAISLLDTIVQSGNALLKVTLAQLINKYQDTIVTLTPNGKHSVVSEIADTFECDIKMAEAIVEAYFILNLSEKESGRLMGKYRADNPSELHNIADQVVHGMSRLYLNDSIPVEALDPSWLVKDYRENAKGTELVDMLYSVLPNLRGNILRVEHGTMPLHKSFGFHLVKADTYTPRLSSCLNLAMRNEDSRQRVALFDVIQRNALGDGALMIQSDTEYRNMIECELDGIYSTSGLARLEGKKQVLKGMIMEWVDRNHPHIIHEYYWYHMLKSLFHTIQLHIPQLDPGLSIKKDDKLLGSPKTNHDIIELASSYQYESEQGFRTVPAHQLTAYMAADLSNVVEYANDKAQFGDTFPWFTWTSDANRQFANIPQLAPTQLTDIAQLVTAFNTNTARNTTLFHECRVAENANPLLAVLNMARRLAVHSMEPPKSNNYPAFLESLDRVPDVPQTKVSKTHFALSRDTDDQPLSLILWVEWLNKPNQAKRSVFYDVANSKKIYDMIVRRYRPTPSGHTVVLYTIQQNYLGDIPLWCFTTFTDDVLLFATSMACSHSDLSSLKYMDHVEMVVLSDDSGKKDCHLACLWPVGQQYSFQRRNITTPTDYPTLHALYEKFCTLVTSGLLAPEDASTTRYFVPHTVEEGGEVDYVDFIVPNQLDTVSYTALLTEENYSLTRPYHPCLSYITFNDEDRTPFILRWYNKDTSLFVPFCSAFLIDNGISQEDFFSERVAYVCLKYGLYNVLSHCIDSNLPFTPFVDFPQPDKELGFKNVAPKHVLHYSVFKAKMDKLVDVVNAWTTSKLANHTELAERLGVLVKEQTRPDAKQLLPLLDSTLDESMEKFAIKYINDRLAGVSTGPDPLSVEALGVILSDEYNKATISKVSAFLQWESFPVVDSDIPTGNPNEHKFIDPESFDWESTAPFGDTGTRKKGMSEAEKAQIRELVMRLSSIVAGSDEDPGIDFTNPDPHLVRSIASIIAEYYSHKKKSDGPAAPKPKRITGEERMHKVSVAAKMWQRTCQVFSSDSELAAAKMLPVFYNMKFTDQSNDTDPLSSGKNAQVAWESTLYFWLLTPQESLNSGFSSLWGFGVKHSNSIHTKVTKALPEQVYTLSDSGGIKKNIRQLLSVASTLSNEMEQKVAATTFIRLTFGKTLKLQSMQIKEPAVDSYREVDFEDAVKLLSKSGFPVLATFYFLNKNKDGEVAREIAMPLVSFTDNARIVFEINLGNSVGFMTYYMEKLQAEVFGDLLYISNVTKWIKLIDNIGAGKTAILFDLSSEPKKVTTLITYTTFVCMLLRGQDVEVWSRSPKRVDTLMKQELEAIPPLYNDVKGEQLCKDVSSLTTEWDGLTTLFVLSYEDLPDQSVLFKPSTVYSIRELKGLTEKKQIKGHLNTTLYEY